MPHLTLPPEIEARLPEQANRGQLLSVLCGKRGFAAGTGIRAAEKRRRSCGTGVIPVRLALDNPGDTYYNTKPW